MQSNRWFIRKSRVLPGLTTERRRSLIRLLNELYPNKTGAQNKRIINNICWPLISPSKVNIILFVRSKCWVFINSKRIFEIKTKQSFWFLGNKFDNNYTLLILYPISYPKSINADYKSIVYQVESNGDFLIVA